MQQATGIVAEYNPLHNGHLYHLAATKKAAGLPVIIIMSGSMVQRGEPALLDKWTRARLAVRYGADLVFELPTAFTLRSAQYFASGAVKLLQACGCVATLSCGAEHPQYDFLSLAESISSTGFQQALHSLIGQGLSYAAAAEAALQSLKMTPAALKTPNDILALEYCRALLGSKMRPLFIQRQGADYNDTQINSQLPSATAIRTAFYEGRTETIADTVPAEVYENICRTGHDRLKLLWPLISYQLRMLTPRQIAGRCQCSEGLENLLKSASSCSDLTEALRCCSTSRYPASRIRRLFLQLLLNRPVTYWQQREPAYLRLLAFNNTGRMLLKSIKSHGQLPVITKLGRRPLQGQNTAFQQQLELDIAAADLLSLLDTKPAGSDYLTSPYYYRN